MSACKALEVELSLRAAGALAPAEAARVDAHLAGCAACRAEAARAAEALALASLPPPSSEERRALRELPTRTLHAIRGAERRRSPLRRIAAAVALGAAVAAVLLAPPPLRREPVAPERSAAVAAWEGPDLDALWDDAAIVELDALAWSGDTEGDVAMYGD